MKLYFTFTQFDFTSTMRNHSFILLTLLTCPPTYHSQEERVRRGTQSHKAFFCFSTGVSRVLRAELLYIKGSAKVKKEVSCGAKGESGRLMILQIYTLASRDVEVGIAALKTIIYNL